MNEEIVKTDTKIETVENETETIKPIYVQVEQNQLNQLIALKKQAEIENQQFKQDMVNIAGLLGYAFNAVKNTDGLFSLIPIRKVGIAAAQGKMPEFTSEEIKKLLLKAKAKVFTDPNMAAVTVELINIINRYTPLFGITPIPDEFITEIANELTK